MDATWKIYRILYENELRGSSFEVLFSNEIL